MTKGHAPSDAELVQRALEGLAGVGMAQATPEHYQRVVATLARQLQGIKRQRGRPPAKADRKLFVAVQAMRAELDREDQARWDADGPRRREEQRQAALEIKRRKDAGDPVLQELRRRQRGHSRRPVGIDQALEAYHKKYDLPGEDFTNSTQPKYRRARDRLVDEFGLSDYLEQPSGKAKRVRFPKDEDSAYDLDAVLLLMIRMDTPSVKD